MTIETVDPSRLPPGTFGLPLIGERPRILELDYMMGQYAKYGPVFKTRVAVFGKVVVFMGPEANRFLLSTGMSYFSWRNGWPVTFKSLLGESLFVQDGDEHRMKRKLLMPAFHKQALFNYLATMEDIAVRYLERWQRIRQFRWLDEYKKFTFEVASSLLAGTEPGDEVDRLSSQFVLMTSGFVTLPINLPFLPYGKALQARDELLKFIDRAIVHRRANPTTDALSLLVQTRDENGNGLSNQELRAQMLLMLFAGHETSASMLTSTMLMLKKHPHVLAKLRAEQASLNLGERLTMDDLRKMPYLEQVLKEVERMYPAVPAGFRRVEETLEFNGYIVPKGWTAIYAINVAHRDPAVYRDPNTFDPERFSAERDEANVPFSLVGFGGGARVCIGYAFAQMEMKIMLSHLVRRYDWTLENENPKFTYLPTLFPRGGLPTTIQPL